MSIFCEYDGGDGDSFDWWWESIANEAPLATKRSRKCCSCGEKISVGDMARKISRFRHATEFEEMRGIASDEVYLAAWYFCEPCGELADSIKELGFCFTLGDQSLKQQIAEYRSEEQAAKKSAAEWAAKQAAAIQQRGLEVVR